MTKITVVFMATLTTIKLLELLLKKLSNTVTKFVVLKKMLPEDYRKFSRKFQPYKDTKKKLSESQTMLRKNLIRFTISTWLPYWWVMTSPLFLDIMLQQIMMLPELLMLLIMQFNRTEEQYKNIILLNRLQNPLMSILIKSKRNLKILMKPLQQHSNTKQLRFRLMHSKELRKLSKMLKSAIKKLKNLKVKLIVPKNPLQKQWKSLK